MTLRSDFRFAIRTMLKTPGLTAAGVIALAMGIGVNSAMFSLADALLLKPLNVPDANGVLVATETPPGKPNLLTAVAPANYLDWTRQQHSFERMAAFQWWNMSLTQSGYPETLHALKVTKDFFSLLHGTAMLGRTFLPEEDQPGHDREIVLSNRLWRERFNADPEIIGRNVQIDLKNYTIVGVMPKSFEFPTGIDLWTPRALDRRESSVRDTRSLFVLGRLRDSVPPGETQAELRTIGERLAVSYPDTNRGWGISLMSMRDFMLGKEVGQYIHMLLGAVAFVLLIACANVSNVLFARSMARQKEIALRVALGAGRWRLIRQMLSESLVLSGAGMVVGLALGYWMVGLLDANMPPRVARFIANWDQLSLDWRAVLFTAAVAAAAGIISGLLPALRASKPDLNSTLKEGARGSSQSQSQHRLKSALLIGEIALSVMLLVGAGLMVRGVAALHNAADVYAPENVLTFTVSLPDSRYKNPIQIADFFKNLQSTLGQIPNTRDVSVASVLPYSFLPSSRVLTVEGHIQDRGAGAGALVNTVSPEYIRLLHIPMRQGRFFNSADDENAPKIAVISESVARRFWPSQNPIGRRLKLGTPDSPEPWRKVAGVVGDIAYTWAEKGMPLSVYIPYTQDPQGFACVALRTSNPNASINTARRKVAKLDAELSISDAKSYSELIQDGLTGLSYLAVMMTVLGIMALVLACVGVYGVMAYSVTERTREIGIRMALGAAARDVVRIVLRRGAMVTIVGSVIGLVCSAAVARLMTSLIFGVSALDLTTFAGVSAALIAVGLLASYIPARRAARVDPLISLRSE